MNSTDIGKKHDATKTASKTHGQNVTKRDWSHRRDIYKVLNDKKYTRRRRTVGVTFGNWIYFSETEEKLVVNWCSF